MSTLGPKLRQPRLDELAALSDLCLRSKAHWDYDTDFLNACRDELTLTQADLRNTALRLAEQDGRPAGVVQVTQGEDPVDLLKLFVDPPFIGQGLGRVLFARAVGAARKQKARAMTIEADPGAVAFYERMGACRIGHAPSGSIPGRTLPLLQLDLTES